MPARTPWNKGKLIGAKPPLKPKYVWSIRAKLQMAARVRDLAMFNLAIDSKLRACDLIALKVEDVAPSGNAVDRATVRQKKTGQPVKFELSEQTRQAVDNYLRVAHKQSVDFLFPSRRGASHCLTTRQYARLISGWIASVGLDPHMFGTHSLRRTKATLIYRRTGNLRAVQLLLGHRRVESTVRYLGIEVDDALAIAEHVDIYRSSGGSNHATYSIPATRDACVNHLKILINRDETTLSTFGTTPGRRRGSARRRYGLPPGAG